MDGGLDRRWLLAAACVAATFVAWSVLADAGPEPDPAPFDPLTEEERSQAVELALANASVDAELSNRSTVVGASLYTDKAFADEDEWPRVAEVWIYDYEANHALRATVDLDDERVTDAGPEPVQPPLATSEIERAGELALDDERVRERLEDAGTPPAEASGTARLWTGTAETACPEHRCALVAFHDGARDVHRFAVLVDLVTASVRDVHELGGHHEEGQP